MLDGNSTSQQVSAFSALVPEFLLYAEVELRFAPQSLLKYRDCLSQIQRILGDREISGYSKQDVLSLKACMHRKGHSVSRQVSILASFKRLLLYCREERNLLVLDPELIVIPKRPRREVLYLSSEEVERFVRAIRLERLDGQLCLAAFRFRTLVEALLGSALRVGELLSLDRSQIDFITHEAKIVGKGSKERVAFFTDRAIFWMKEYLRMRKDTHPALFVCLGGRSRLKRTDLWRPFGRYRKLAGIMKPVTPHLLRHTAATQLLFNGCPIGHIKEILGHERLETTCRYYLGLDHRAAKQAHHRFLLYPRTEGGQVRAE